MPDGSNYAPLPRTMAALIERIAADPLLPPKRRRALVGAVRDVLRLIGADLSSETNLGAVRSQLSRFSPRSAGLNPRTWANKLSFFRAALRYAQPARRKPSAMDPRYRTLLRASLDKSMAVGLTRLFGWLSEAGVAPDAVTDAVMLDFKEHLETDTTVAKPHKVIQVACRQWNRAAMSIPAWPQQRLTVPMVRDIISLDLANFPLSFREDLERYEAIMSGRDLTAANAPDKPLRPDTLAGHLKRLRLFASLHVHSGVAVDQITAIETLFAKPNLEQALQWYRDKLQNLKPCLFDLAAMLSTMGRKYLQLDDTRLKELETIKKRLRCREWGMTGKVRKRLAQLRDPENQRLFLTFHDLLLKEARRYPNHSEAAAVLVQTALIHALLLVAPMRFRNLVMLCLDQHFAFARPGREGQVTIQIPGEQVKNGVALEYVLPDEVAGLLKLYFEQYRPFFLKDGASPCLFPGKVNAHKHQVTLQGQLCRRLHEYTGITFHPHAYRHAAALFYLQRHPTDYETVRRLLGHRSLDTTIRFYMEFEQFLASTRYNAVIDEMRETASRSEPKRRAVGQSGGRT